MANDPALEVLANMLKGTQHRRVIENTPGVSVRATPPQLPQFQIPGMNATPVGTPPFIPAPQPPNPPSPTVQTAPAPPPVTGPGDQLPSVMTRSATAADAGNDISKSGPDTPGFWQRFNKAIASGQVPEGYRGVMGELIKNG